MKFVIQRDGKTSCSVCRSKVDLLVEEYVKTKIMFYICWNCKQVVRVGKGIVERTS